MFKSWCCGTQQTGAKFVAIISLLWSVGLIVEEVYLVARHGCNGIRAIAEQNPEYGDSHLIDSPAFDVSQHGSLNGSHPVLLNKNSSSSYKIDLKKPEVIQKPTEKPQKKFGQFKPGICQMPTSELVLSGAWVASWFGDIALAITLIIGARKRSIPLCLIWFHIRCALLIFRIIFIAIYLIAGLNVLAKVPVILLCCFRLYSIWVVGDFIQEMREEKETTKFRA